MRALRARQTSINFGATFLAAESDVQPKYPVIPRHSRARGYDVRMARRVNPRWPQVILPS